MGEELNPKIVGATIVGFALVAGAYVTSNFGEPSAKYQAASVTTSQFERAPIEVFDSDNNGLEDWRDSFVTNEVETIVPENLVDTAYTPPTTLTGKTSVGLMEDIIESKIYGPFSNSKEEIIENTLLSFDQEAAIDLYDFSDIDIMTDWEDEDIVNYANTLSVTLQVHSKPDLASGLDILNDVVRKGEDEKLAELEALVEVFKNYRDDALLIPVPDVLAKTHLDLINSFQAIYEDYSGMALINEDPIKSVIHLKRIPDDSEALRLALENLFTSFAEYFELFDREDPAVMFVIFSPDYQRNN